MAKRNPVALVSHIAAAVFSDLSGPVTISKGPFWAAVETRSLLMSFRHIALVFTAAWQLVMVVTVLGSLGADGIWLAIALASIGVGAMLARAGLRVDALISTGMAATGLWSYLASGDIDSALVFAACWQINFATCMAMALVLRPYGVPLAAGVVVVLIAVMAVTLPEWGVDTLVSIFTTQLAIIVAVRWGVSRLVALASDADDAAARRTAAQQRSRLIDTVISSLAEEARILHDTAINTLGAIADGGTDNVDSRQVQEQCARDVDLLRVLRTRSGDLSSERLDDLFVSPGFAIRRRGLSDTELEIVGRRLQASTVTALVRVVREAVTNAAQHSGADHAVIDIGTTASVLTVTVEDYGRGFDRTARPEGRGLGGSIIGRAHDNGFHASVASRPGEGTRVTLEVPLDGVERDDGVRDDGVRDGGERNGGEDQTPWKSTVGLFQRSSEMWAIGVTGVSVVLTAAGASNHQLALFPMIALMAVTCLVYLYVPGFRSHPLASVWLTVVVVTVFILSAVAVDFGSGGPLHWQALAPTGAFILLLTLTSSRRTRGLAAAAWVATILAVAYSGLSHSLTAGGIVLVAGIVGLGFTGLWASLEWMFAALGRDATTAEREAHEAWLRAELAEASQKSSRRWMEAGLDSTIGVLDAIAGGMSDPADSAIRQVCGDEEQYLRQLIQIDPKLVNLSRALPATLARARDRGVAYHLHLGDADTSDEATSTAIAGYISETLVGLRSRDELRVSLFPVGDDLRLTLVGQSFDTPHFGDVHVTHSHLGEVDLVEMTFSSSVRQ